jgi:hypothetical protein
VSHFAFVDATVWIGGFDFTADSNQVSLQLSTTELDNTCFGQTHRSRIAGLRNTAMTANGNWYSATADAPDPHLFANLGTKDRVYTIADDSAEGSTAYMFQGIQSSYDLFGQLDQVTPWAVNASGSNKQGCVRGQTAKAKGNVSATGATGSVVNLGAVSATQYVYAALHVFSAGTTITVQVQSDDSGAFASPTTRGTFSGITTAGGTWLTRVAGSITDTHWRFNVSAVTGTFSIGGAIGIR